MSKSILRDAPALMIFIESDETFSTRQSIDRELQVVVQPDATVRDNVRIAQHDNTSKAVRVVAQQRSALIGNVHDWSPCCYRISLRRQVGRIKLVPALPGRSYDAESRGKTRRHYRVNTARENGGLYRLHRSDIPCH